MASKSKSVWYCTSCGNESPKWMGRCPACGEWNTMVEAPAEAKKAAGGSARSSSEARKPRKLSDVDFSAEARKALGIPADRTMESLQKELQAKAEQMQQ